MPLETYMNPLTGEYYFTLHPDDEPAPKGWIRLRPLPVPNRTESWNPPPEAWADPETGEVGLFAVPEERPPSGWVRLTPIFRRPSKEAGEETRRKPRRAKRVKE